MHIAIATAHAGLGYELAADLEAQGLGPAVVRKAAPEGFTLRHPHTMAAAQVARLLGALAPLHPDEVIPDPNAAAVTLELGPLESLKGCRIAVHADSPELIGRTRTALEGLGLNPAVTELGVQDGDRLHHDGQHGLARQVLTWALRRRGFTVEEQEHPAWDDDRPGLFVYLRDPAQQQRPLRDRFAVEIAADDPDVAARLTARLEAEGFRCRPGQPLPPQAPRFRLQPGPFSADRAPGDLARLRVAVESQLGEQGIDADRYPLEVTTVTTGAAARIELPVAACRAGELRPYAGPHPERFDIIIYTDDVNEAGPLEAALASAGFTSIHVREVTSLLDAPDGDMPAGFQIQWGAAAQEPAIARAVREAVVQCQRPLGVPPELAPVASACFAEGDTDVFLFFPVKGVADGRLAAHLANPHGFALKLYCADPTEWADLERELAGWGFSGVEVLAAEQPARRRIEYGGASPLLINRLSDLLQVRYGLRLPNRKAWDSRDRDVWIHLPPRPKRGRPATPEAVAPDLGAWVRGPEVMGEPQPFLAVTADQVRVGGVKLPRRPEAPGPFVPDVADFAHLCLDGPTAETLEHLATGVLLREPCLLEGETSTSKTTTVLYLAALLRQPVVRLNLHGQTDTGELIGRYTPAVAQASGVRRQASEISAEAFGGEPEAPPPDAPWCWRDGLVVQALKRGWWVLLDEVNLAEPQILERLNSVLEPEPSLVLTEHDNSVLGRGGVAVHPGFRIFATMNPAEYAGRSVLSPAYRDRWRGYRQVPRPGEGEYLAMLRLLVHGEQPEVTVLGRRFRGGKAAARYPQLADLGDGLLQALARFQAALEGAAGQQDSAAHLGARRKERYVFTRRGLLSLLEYLAQTGPEAVRPALLRYYLGRVAAAEDRQLVVQLLDAAGIGPTTWTVAEPPGA